MKLARISIKVLVAICFIVPILVSCSKQEERLDVVKQLIITKPESGTLSLEQGDSYKISYRTVLEEAINTVPVVWSSSNEEVATVRNGRVNAYAQGKAQIKAQCGDAEAVVNLKVTAVSIESFIVPSSMNVLVGIPVKVNLEIKPDKANATSLEWSVDKPDDFEIEFVEGDAMLTAQKEGTFTVTVKDQEIGSKKITVKSTEASKVLGLSYRSIKGEVVTISEDMTVSSTDIQGGNVAPDRSFKVKLGSGKAIDLKKLTVTVGDTTVCQAVVSAGADAGTADVKLETGLSFKETSVRVEYEDDAFDGQTVKRNFIYKSVAAGATDGKIQLTYIQNGTTFVYPMPPTNVNLVTNQSIEYRSKDGCFLHWELSDTDMATMTPVGGTEYWSKGAKIVCGNKGGKFRLTATDQTGNRFAFDINVTGNDVFPNDMTIIDLPSDGKVLMSNQFPFRTFMLSKAGYKASWTVSNTQHFEITPITPVDNSARAELELKLSYRDEEACLGYSTDVTVTDEAGINSIKFTVSIARDLYGKEFCVGDYPKKNKKFMYEVTSQTPRITCRIRDEENWKPLPKFDQYMTFEGESKNINGRTVKLYITDIDYANGTFVVNGDFRGCSSETALEFTVKDYKGKTVRGSILYKP